MATSTLLGIDTDPLASSPSATGIDSLGPSDASDSGSDSIGVYSADPDSDTDRFGTGERGSAEPDEQSRAQDILPDHIEAIDPDGTNPAAQQAEIALGSDEGTATDEPPEAQG